MVSYKTIGFFFVVSLHRRVGAVVVSLEGLWVFWTGSRVFLCWNRYYEY